MKPLPGVYETEYGNAAEVYNWNDSTAYDLDMGEEIPIEMVTGKRLGDIE
jgi:hypothetical protein